MLPVLGGAVHEGLVTLSEEATRSAKKSLTHFEVVARGEVAAACRVRPVTGRMHQIRVHAEMVGHPLAGDLQYGLQRQPTGGASCDRLLLHASSLTIAHPTRRELIKFTAPPPEQFTSAAAGLGVPVEGSALAALAAEEGGAEWTGEAPDTFYEY